LEISALTSINIASTLGEIIRIEEKTSDHVFQKFENSWLARYPRPIRVIHDQGGEFTGHPFQTGLHQLGIAAAPITSKNPQANAVCE
jgi:transposase InsO family protein